MSSSEHISTTSRASSLHSESSLISESVGVFAGVTTSHPFFFPLSCWYKNLLTILKNGVKSLFAIAGQSCRFLSSTICSAHFFERICFTPAVLHWIPGYLLYRFYVLC
eukprot:g48381.t1